MLACEAQSRATWVLALLMSLKVDKESFKIILMEIKSDTFSLLDRCSACMVLARFYIRVYTKQHSNILEDENVTNGSEALTLTVVGKAY